MKRKTNKYKEFPYTLSECENCSIEIPTYEHLCSRCIELLQEEDLYKLQARLAKMYLYGGNQPKRKRA